MAQTRLDTDFNIRKALRGGRSQLLGAQETGRAALAGYEELAPKYNTALEQARSYQSTLTRDYNRYVTDRNEAVGSYNRDLQQRYQTYQSATAQGSGLESSYKAAQQELGRLGGIKDSYATAATQIYGQYSSAYQAGTQAGQQQYDTKLSDFQQQFQKIRQDYLGFESNITGLNEQIRTQQGNIESQRKFANQYLNTAELAGRYVVDSTNKIYRVFTDNNNQFAGAQEYRPQGSGFAQGLGRVTDSGYGSLTEVVKFLSRQGTKTFADAVYENYRRGASQYRTYQAVANRANTYSSYAQTALNQAKTYETNIQGYQSDIQRNRQSITETNQRGTDAYQEYQNFINDKDFVTRVAQEQSAGALQNYQNYLQNTYNPSVNTFNQYASSTYNPAAQAYQDFMNSGQVQQALQSYQSLQQDTGYVDRAASDTKAVYDASQQEYSDLQAAYQGMTPQLNEYSEQVETSKQQVQAISGQIPGLQRSLAIDTEARKRGDRLGYRRSILSKGFKRRGTAR